MPKAATQTPFRLFEGLVVSLYDGGVLAPAVLERVIGAFAQSGIDWRSAIGGRAVDGRSLHEIVALTMLPGKSQGSALAAFMRIVEHIAGVALSADDAGAAAADDGEAGRKRRRKIGETDGDDDARSEDLLAQLSGGARPGKRRGSNKTELPAKADGFSPLTNAALPRGRKV